MALILGIAVSSPAQTKQLPISSFIAVQGATQVVAWSDPATLNLLAFDAFGKRDTTFGLNLGTSVSGRVTVRNLGGGTDRVTVVAQTKNALCWGFANNVLAFGRLQAEVLGGSPASTGNGTTRIEFTKPTGSPLPTWNQIVLGAPPYVWESVTTSITCSEGELRPGSGYPDGTPGFAHTTQTGLFNTGAPSGCPPEKDENCFPAEKIQFQPTGN